LPEQLAIFWQLDNDVIVGLSIGVAPQNFFDISGCTALFFDGIVSISLLPSSTKMMANGSRSGPVARRLQDRIATSIDYMACGISWSRYRTPLTLPGPTHARQANAV
jgi:hypothetical protein